MKRIRFVRKAIWFMVAAWPCSGLWAQPTYTLKACIDSAMANNLSIIQGGLQVERADANYKQSRNNRLPSVNGNFFLGGSRGRSIDPFTNAFVEQAFNNSNAGVNASLPVFAGGQIHHGIAQNEALLQASELDLQQAKDNLVLNVIANYLQVLAGEDQLDIARKQTDVSAQQVSRLQIVANEGATAPYNLTDLKGELASNTISVINGRNGVEQAKIALCRLMNVRYDSAMRLSRDQLSLQAAGYEATATQVYTEAMNYMAMVKATQRREEAAKHALRMAKGQLWPTVSLGGGLGTNYSSAAQRFSLANEFYAVTDAYVESGGSRLPVYTKQQEFAKEPFGFGLQYRDNLNAQFGLSVQVPILNGLLVRNRIAQAKIDMRNAQAVTTNTALQLNQDVDQAWQNMRASYERWQTLQQQVEALRESFRAAEVRFNNGVINSAEYLVIKNNYDRSVVNQTQANYEFVLRTKILDYYRGRL